MSEVITASIHLGANSRAELDEVPATARCSGFCSIEIRAHRARYSHILLLLPETATRDQAQAIVDAINAALAAPEIAQAAE